MLLVLLLMVFLISSTEKSDILGLMTLCQGVTSSTKYKKATLVLIGLQAKVKCTSRTNNTPK
jgi:hypothetical protein